MANGQPPIHGSSDQNDTTDNAAPVVEYDDFGLPIRKPRPRTPLPDSSDSEEDEFKDAVASKAGSQEGISPVLEKSNAAVTLDMKSEGYPVADTPAGKTERLSNDPLKSNVRSAEPDVKAEEPEPKPDSQETKVAADMTENRNSLVPNPSEGHRTFAASEWSHQQLAPRDQDKEKAKNSEDDDDDEWQEMPAYAPYDIYDEDNRLVAREHNEDVADDETYGYAGLGGAGKGYTRVLVDEDAESATSMDDNTKYLFKDVRTTSLTEDDEQTRDAVSQMQATKDLLTEGQRIAYVGLTRLEMSVMVKEMEISEGNKKTKKELAIASETLKMWSQKMMIRLYSHMDISTPEQIMIEQLDAHGVMPSDLTSILMANARVKADAANTFLDEQDLFVSEAFVDEGTTLKRFQPRAQGRAFQILKRTSHITIVLTTPDEGKK